MKKAFFSTIIVFLVFFSACKKNEPKIAYQYETNPQYTWGYATFYGAYYGNYGNENNVFSLSLFTDLLYVDDSNSLAGHGQYLFLEDVFLSSTDSTLLSGNYTVSDSGEPFTIGPGTVYVTDDFQYTYGSFIYYKEKRDSNTAMKLISEGYMQIEDSGDISFDFTLNDDSVLKGKYTAPTATFIQNMLNNENTPREIIYLYESPQKERRQLVLE